MFTKNPVMKRLNGAENIPKNNALLSSHENPVKAKMDKNRPNGRANKPPISQCDQAGIGRKESGAGKK